MAVEPNGVQQNHESSSPKLIEGQQAPVEGNEDKNRSARHPRWTRQETLILIEGKKVAENRGRKGRRSTSVFASEQLEPKWDLVSSYCKQHGVNRGPVQCRKRWSNLVGDFKKIKTWESQAQGESYWMIRNDLRKDNKLPGYFDKEVYDVLDGRAITAEAYQLALVTITAEGKYSDDAEAVAAEEVVEEEEEAQLLFDSARQATTENDLFSDTEKLGEMELEGSNVKERTSTEEPARKIPAPKPISERKFHPFSQTYCNQGTTKDQQPSSQFCKGFSSHVGCKRRRLSLDDCEDTNLEDQVINVLDKNANILNAQLEAQIMKSQLDREQQKDHNENLVAALNKITDALMKIADKL